MKVFTEIVEIYFQVFTFFESYLLVYKKIISGPISTLLLYAKKKKKKTEEEEEGVVAS
jgi:hypothetical protein